MSKFSGEDVISDVHRRIKREQKMIQGARSMRRSTENPAVRQQCDTNIQEAEKNIKYLEDKLRDLSVKAAAASSGKPANPVDSTDLAVAEPAKSHITRLELLKYDNTHMGQRIQLMLQQLDFKLSLEQQYKAGIQKLQTLYQQDGDRRSAAEAASNLAESNAKMALLSRSLKRYSDLHLGIDDDGADNENILPNNRRPLTGTLHLSIKQILDVDHTTTSTWSQSPETFIVIKVENQTVAETRISKSSVFNEDVAIPVDKANEIELLVYDRAAGSQTPVAIMWLRLSDVVEAIRRKRVELHNTSGWANADTVQRHQSQMPANGESPVAAGTAKTGPPIVKRDTTALSPTADNDPTIEDWFILEPAGRIQLKLGFEKTSTGVKRSYGAYNEGLGRHNAIRKHEETQEVHGHEFAHHQVYNIMTCAICGEFMTYPYQCVECRFACHRKCVSKVVTKCISQASTDLDHEDQLNHRIPHRLEPTSNMSANWCAHCGMILPLGKKNVRKCTECGVMCHANCVRFIPDFCGMSMEMAYQIVSEIKSTRIRQVTKAAASAKSGSSASTVASKGSWPSLSDASTLNEPVHSGSYKPYASGRVTHNLPPVKSQSPREPIRRKQVGSGPSQNRQVSGQSMVSTLDGHANSADVSPQQSPARKLDRMSMGAKLEDFDAFIPSIGASGNVSPVKSEFEEDAKKANKDQPQGKPWWSQEYDKSTDFDDDSRDDSRIYTQPEPEKPAQVSAEEARQHQESIEAQARQAIAQKAAYEEGLRQGRPHAQAQEQARASYLATQAEQEAEHEAEPEPETSRVPMIIEEEPPAPAAAHPDVSTAATEPAVSNVAAAEAAAASLLGQNLSNSGDRPMSVYANRPLSTADGVANVAGRKKRRRKVGLDDFSFLAVLGKGNFGKVMLAESKHSKQLYAIKVLKKNYILENREVESMRSEKRVFLIANRENHPFLVNLFAAFQTENRIYFVMDYVSGGDLMYHIQKELFTPRQAQFYAAEVLLALKHFHDNDVIYRDLKLDNILLTLDGHIKVADYGLCKEEMGFTKTTGTFCGTPEFMAPEILLDQKYGRSVDWWALGVLIYQMLLGKSPFHGKDDEEIYDSILSDEPLYPIHMPRDSVSILQQLLTRDPSRRLGCGPRDALEIMEHPYFANINFDDLLNLQVETPYQPMIDSPADVRFFDKEFTSETPALTPMNSTIEPNMQEQFRGFSYMSNDQI